jgi:16S rRNA G966 N2-methylase RsmD
VKSIQEQHSMTHTPHQVRGYIKNNRQKKRQEKKNKVFIPPPYQPNAFKETEMYQ